MKVIVEHEIEDNKTTCKVRVYDGGFSGEQVLLDPSSYFKFDGLLLSYHPYWEAYRVTASPGESHLFRYHDYNGIVHKKNISKTDSLNIVNLPDQIDATHDLNLQISGEPLIDYEYAYLVIRDDTNNLIGIYDIDSSNTTITIPANSCQPNSIYKFILKRSAYENDSQFFAGDLNISVSTIVEREVATN